MGWGCTVLHTVAPKASLLTLSTVQGAWSNGRWFIAPNGDAYFEGERRGGEFDLYVGDDAIIKRFDGWQVDMISSTATRLIWMKQNEPDVEWTRSDARAAEATLHDRIERQAAKL